MKKIYLIVRWFHGPDLGKALSERLALNPRDLEFQSRRSPRIIKTSESSGTPRAPSVNILHTIQLVERGLIPQRYVDDTVVNEGTQGFLDRLFLAASLGCHRNENPSVFAGESTGSPEFTGRVPKGLPLSGVVSVLSGDAEEEGVIGSEGLERDHWVVWFCRSMPLLQHLLREGFWDSGKTKPEFIGSRERDGVGTPTGRLLRYRLQIRHLPLCILRLVVI